MSGSFQLTSRDNIRRLAQYIRRRLTKAEPFVLLLGAGASRGSGYPDGREFVDQFLSQALGRDVSHLADPEKRAAFDREWRSAGAKNVELLIDNIFPRTPPSLGYHAITYLAHRGLLKTILTTNPDSLLDQAFAQAQPELRGHQILVVGRDPNPRIKDAITAPGGQIGIVKLHGDIRSGRFAFANEEIQRFHRSIEGTLRDCLAQDLIVVGHSLSDPDVQSCLRRRNRIAQGGPVWYVSPERPGEFARELLQARDSEGNIVDGEYGDFDRFFHALASDIDGGSEAAMSTFESRFEEHDLEGIVSVAGSYGTKDGQLHLGKPGLGGVVRLPVLIRDGFVKVTFRILEDGGDESNWFGCLVKASAPDFRTGYLVYLRSNGSLDIHSPELQIEDSKPTGVTKGNLVNLTIRFEGDTIEASLDEKPDSFVRFHRDDIAGRWGQVFMWALGTHSVVSKVSTHPLEDRTT